MNPPGFFPHVSSRSSLLFACALALSACGGEADPPSDGAATGDASDEIRGYDAEPVPEGGGSGVPGDVNGDGFPDLVFPGGYDPDAEDARQVLRLVVVHGSPDGPDPAARTVWPGEPARSDEAPSAGRVAGTADLDGDGFADILVGDARPGILWGGPTGIDPESDLTPADLPPAEDEYASSGSAIGDFDGDGAADVAHIRAASWWEEEGAHLTVLHGPFDRDGTPRHSSPGTLEAPFGDLVAEPPRADGGPSALLLRHPADGGQPGNTLLVTGPGDPQEWNEVELLRGGLAAFGDVDGDGETDLALADSGTRNNEPGFETEPPEVDHRMNVYTGPLGGAADPLSVVLPGTETSASFTLRTMAACDLDGDGTTELWVGLAGRGVDAVADTGDGPRVREDTGPLVRLGPETGPLGSGEQWERTARVHSCGDHDGDGSDELALAYEYGGAWPQPVRWWIVGDGGEDEASFDSAGFTD